MFGLKAKPPAQAEMGNSVDENGNDLKFCRDCCWVQQTFDEPRCLRPLLQPVPEVDIVTGTIIARSGKLTPRMIAS